MALAMFASGLAFGHSDAAPLFHDVHVHLTPGFHGLVGPNGAGKTTLLRLFAGELSPDAGQVRVEPHGALVVLCPQEVTAITADIAALADRDDGDAHRWRAELGLDDAALARWPTLSPGERKRWQIAAALARDPDVLLLDEPTNHVDGEARRALVAALGRFRGVGVIVSHDRALLDALTRSTLRIDRGRVEAQPGNYAAARAEWERERLEADRERDKARHVAESAERRLAEARAHRSAIEQGASMKRRMKGVRDHDARGGLAKGKLAAAEAKLGRMVGVRRAEAERAAERLDGAVVEKELGGSIFVGYEPAPRSRVLALVADEVRAGPHRVLGRVHLAVGPRDRVAVTGPNGAGKSTLLAALVEASTVPRDRLLVLPQEIDADDARAHLDDLRRLPPDDRGRVLSVAAALGVDAERLLASRRPSPGEARKLLLARALGMRVWALVLDEPTNHLDLPSIERVERALRSFPGAIVIATHDDALARLCTTRWRVESGRVEVSGS